MDNKRIAEILSLSKEHLMTRKEIQKYKGNTLPYYSYKDKFICHAIYILTKLNKISYGEANAVRSFIRYQLEKYPTLEQFLQSKGVPGNLYRDPRVQTHRWKWLNKMIKELNNG
jgi:hypothetical protein